MAGEIDEFTFSGSAGDVVLIRLAEVSSILEPRIVLLRPGGSMIGETWDYDVAEITYAGLPVTGTYTIRVLDEGADDLGDYSVHLQRLNGPVGGAAIVRSRLRPGRWSTGRRRDRIC